MLRTVLALLSSLQVGARIKETYDRWVRQGIAVAIAGVLLLAAAAFGLFSAYQALVAPYGFTRLEAAAIMAGVLLAFGLLVLAVLPALGKKPRVRQPVMLTRSGEGMDLVDRGVGRAMQQVGPLTVLVIAFAAGLLAGRR